MVAIQTFLPYADFVVSAQSLDTKRLGKQRVETLQILNTLLGVSKGWVNHPAVKMWRGYETTLVSYGVAICDEWVGRGYKDTCRGKILALSSLIQPDTSAGESLVHSGVERVPGWLGNTDLHISHQSNLIRKDPIHYSPIFVGVPDNLPYYWPSA